jgi:hypothetical protein
MTGFLGGLLPAACSLGVAGTTQVFKSGMLPA